MAATTTSVLSPAQTRDRKRSRLGPLIHFLEHQFLRFRTTFRGTVVSGAVGPLFYLLGLGLGLGSQINAQESGLQTSSYLDFVGPGLMAAAAMQLGASESLWQTAGQLRWRGTYVSITNTPLTIGQLFTGHVVWIGFRALVGAAIYLLVLTGFGIPTSPRALLAPLAAVGTAMAFAALVSAWTGHTKQDQTFAVILRLGILPLYLFSGAFYPVEQLPDALAWFSRLTPVWHGVQLCRGLIIDRGLTLEAGIGHAAVLLAFTFVGILAGRRTFTTALGS
ncbi:MAG: ABC transporter permease [Acidimicrobiales bacterium]